MPLVVEFARALQDGMVGRDPSWRPATSRGHDQARGNEVLSLLEAKPAFSLAKRGILQREGVVARPLQ